MSTGIQACEIVLPGYVLTERIGSGGYAEVWRAEAPGGIEKAVKIVYGHYDDEFASQELKALERIKGVRHPFLLSLERFEVLNGRLAILTELADMSLDQRLRQCRADGLPGIPRDELMRYLADTAEALDFLSQRHNLLHLDIKPENLLISGDHIKVADFGLVKELATRTQNSLVSGMTPTYAAPEMFDDEPTAFSDQYSLAIVYQEMLVGTLPFPGRTAAQLAKQHTQAEPQLMSLPAEDRPVIGKALAKNPTDRFPCCRAFVDVLLRHTGSPQLALSNHLPRPIPETPRPAAPDPDDTKPSSFHTTLRRTPVQAPDSGGTTVTQPVQRVPSQAATVTPEPIVAEDIVDIAVPEADTPLRREQPTLYLAAGGVGIQVLCRLRALTALSAATESAALDTDRDELRGACSSRWKSPLLPDDTLHLPLRLSNCYDDSRELLNWVSRRWLYNIPRSLETRGYRPLGRIALVDHVQRVRELIDRKIGRLATTLKSVTNSEDVLDETIRVVVLAGTGGGTGAGVAIDIANAARSLAAGHNLKIEVHGYLVCTCFGNKSSTPLDAANTYSFLQELNHATAFGNERPGEKASQAPLFESSAAPFDYVYCVPTQSCTTDTQPSDVLDTVARYLALETIPDARMALRSCRNSHTPRERSPAQSLTLKKFGYASLTDQRRRIIRGLAADLTDAVKRHWIAGDRSANWEQLVREEHEAATVPRLDMVTEGDSNSLPTVTPVSETTALELRGRFKEYMSLEFASEVLRHIQCQLASRDDRGRPLILSRDAKLIADTAYAVATALAERMKNESDCNSLFSGSAVFQSLIAAGSRRVLSDAVKNFDLRQPERFLSADEIDELIQAECEVLLEESLARPDLAGAVSALIDNRKVILLALEHATTSLLQCGSDRRTLLLVPKNHARPEFEQHLRYARPLASVVHANVEHVVLLSEETGISPRSFMLGLERVYPGIADAAARLHTRIDIQWLNQI
jgi:serine/threonine protein kinase